MSDDKNELGIVARMLSFEPPRNGGASPPDYTETFDHDEANGRAAALAGYVDLYAAETGNANVCKVVEAENNGFTIDRSSGEKLLVRCFGADIFDLIRFPAPVEIEREKSIFHEMVLDLDTDVMITLVRRFIQDGSFAGGDA